MIDTESRIKLMWPVNFIIGYANGAKTLPADCQDWARGLIEVADKLKDAWLEVTDSNDEKTQ